VLAGVARGLAEHLGVEVSAVRVAFLLLALAGGAGVAMYALFWMFAPQREVSGERVPPRELGYLIAVGSLAVAAVVVIQVVGGSVSGGVVWAVVVAGAGVVVLWGQADDAQRARLRAATGTARALGLPPRRRRRRARHRRRSDPAGPGHRRRYGPPGGAAALVVVAGLALVSGPWWLRMARELTAERAARIRELERAEIAAHVHDSVLHTLALIQRHAGDPREVGRLARAQERELRTWLYRPPPAETLTLRAALERAAAEVEDAHGATVDVVVVGDCPVDEPGSALLHATREALVNAAKYAGAAPVSLYAEVGEDRIEVFVRDRGPGFDLARVPADRMGVRQSVIGRMERHGGRAVVRSASGAGTEIRLELPRRPPT
jgi:signal transduction histidine kinase